MAAYKQAAKHNDVPWFSIGSSLLVAALGVLVFESAAGRALQRLGYDWLQNIQSRRNPAEAVIVVMDDDSHAKLDQSYLKPWDRGLHAQLLERLTQDNPKAVVFDIVFSDPGAEPEKDKKLAQAIRANGNVILGAHYIPGSQGQQVHPPFDMFAQEAAGIGTVDLAADSDIVCRRIRSPSEIGNALLSSLSESAAELVHPNNRKPNRNRWLRHYCLV